MVDLVAEITDVPAVLIMRLQDPEIEVLVASRNPDNPYASGQKEQLWGSNLFCEKVIQGRQLCRVEDARGDDCWKDNPALKLHMIAYLGFPILMSDGAVFGTICMLDRRANRFSSAVEKLAQRFRATVETDLRLLEMNRRLSEDVAARKHAEEVLEKSRLELAEAQRLAHVGNWVWDSVADAVEWSDELFRIFGLEPQARAPSFSEQQTLLTSEAMAELKTAMRRTLETGAPYEVAVDVLRPDGARRHTVARGERIAGRPGWLRGTLADVTELREAEQALLVRQAELERAKEAAEQANRAKGLFLANISHEVRTPLSALVGLSQAMVRMGERSGLPADFLRLLEQIRSGGRYLNLLLTNLLDVSTLETGKMRLRCGRLALDEWSRSIRDVLEPIARSRPVELRWHDEALAGQALECDPMRLGQILINLAHNAIKFTPPGKGVDVRFERRPGFFALEVSDEGPGLPEDHGGMFKAFEGGAAQDSGLGLEHGVGLGLYVVKSSAQMMGGRVTAANRPCGGACFRVEWNSDDVWSGE